MPIKFFFENYILNFRGFLSSIKCLINKFKKSKRISGTFLLYIKCRVGFCNEYVKFELNDIPIVNEKRF